MPVKKFLRDAQKIQEQHYRRHEEKSHASDSHDESNWLVSYADMMTLLCGFFIMLFSMAKLDDTKYEKVKEELSKQFHGKYEAPSTNELAKFVTQVVQEMGVEKDTVVRADATGVSVAFQSTVFFDTLSSEVRPQGRQVLDRLIEAVSVRQNQEKKQYRVVVEGHTDSRPVLGGAFPSNWELSGARAARVVRLFLTKGFAPDHLTAIGYADTRPQMNSRKADGSWNEEALGKNRRVVLRIMEPKVDSIPFPDTEKPVSEGEVASAAVTATSPGTGTAVPNAGATATNAVPSMSAVPNTSASGIPSGNPY